MTSVEQVAGDVPVEADYVVVGGGAAGCVLAARLSEDTDSIVLLLEAGPVWNTDGIAVPGRAPHVQTKPFVDQSTTVPQAGLGGRRVSVLAGHGLGGGSSVNSMAWFQGEPLDYDGWRDAGADGWSWSSVGPELRDVEDHELGATVRHGSGGPMAVSTPRHVEPLTVAFVEACSRRSIVVGGELDGTPSNVSSPDRAGLVPSNIRDGRRWSVVDGYLTPAAGRPNLLVHAGVRVASLLLDATRVVGVRLHGTGREVHARRGVVLAAGAIRTPQVLMLSGIGPATHLHEIGIPVAVDLPGVGTGLRDHPLVPMMWPVRDDPPPTDPATHDPERVYHLLRRGPLSSFGQGIAIVRSTPTAPAPDLHLIITSPVRGPAVAALTGDDSARAPAAAIAGVVALLTPESSGTVRLSGPGVDDPLEVDPGYLNHPDDGARLRAGLSRLLDIFTTAPLDDRLGSPIGLEAAASDAELDAYIRTALASYHHPIGTARMGIDAGAVVAPDLLLRGLQGLHIADSSVFPTTVRANTHAPVIALAERAARLIRSESRSA